MRPGSSCNMWVFRDGRSSAAGRTMRDGLAAVLRGLGTPPGREPLMNALLRAGELECALEDAAADDTRPMAAITDVLASALLGLPGSEDRLKKLPAILETIETPEVLNLSIPEGFAYYALNPLDFAELAAQTVLSGPQAAVVGIRSIGTTLSAVTAAALARRGVRAQRITVRPSGHPFDRRTQLAHAQSSWVAWQRARDADFLVVDEGPGISGSSFLSVCDALLELGVERRRITLLCSRHADPDLLTARDAAVRWRALRSLYPGPTLYVPAEAKVYAGGGEWRRHFYEDEAQWPESWSQMERLKFFSRDGARLYKFEGLGRFGQAAAERARQLAEGGFAPPARQHDSGFAEYPVLAGRPMTAGDLSAAVLERITDYCAFRAAEFALPGDPNSQLDEMVRFNAGEEFGIELNGPGLQTERLVMADGRMLPHEWRATPAGLFKTDGVSHGDDHFFPGPTDIAWDLAGAMVEWEMPPHAVEYLLKRYRARSGDDPRARLQPYRLAYSVFRMAYCAMAAFALRGTEEEKRLRRAWQRYRARVENEIRARTVVSGRWPVASAAPSEPEMAAD